MHSLSGHLAGRLHMRGPCHYDMQCRSMEANCAHGNASATNPQEALWTELLPTSSPRAANARKPPSTLQDREARHLQQRMPWHPAPRRSRSTSTRFGWRHGRLVRCRLRADRHRPDSEGRPPFLAALRSPSGRPCSSLRRALPPDAAPVSSRPTRPGREQRRPPARWGGVERRINQKGFIFHRHGVTVGESIAGRTSCQTSPVAR